MKYFTALLAVAAAVSAKTLSDYLPECAVECLTPAISAATKCKGPDDLLCFCEVDNYRAIYSSGVGCVLASCGNDVSLGEVLPAAQNMCETELRAAGKPVTSVGDPTPSDSKTTPAETTPTPAATSVTVTTPTPADASTESTTAPAPASTTSGNSVAGLSAHMVGVVAPFFLAAAANL